MRTNRKRKYLWAAVLVITLTGILSSWPARAQNKDKEMPPGATSIPLLVALGRNQCTPCKMMAPVLDDLKREYAGVLNIEFIDIREKPEAVKKYAIHGIPFQILYDASGKELKRHYGYMSREEILNMLKQMGIETKKTQKEKKK